MVDVETGAPVTRVSVMAMPFGGATNNIWRTGPGTGHISDDAGRFTIREVTGGRQVDATGDGTVEVGDIEVLELRLPRGARAGDLGFTLAEIPRDTDPAEAMLAVASVRADGPAARAGLIVGDVIVEGRDCRGEQAWQFDPLVSAPAGTVLRFGLARGETVAIKLGRPQQRSREGAVRSVAIPPRCRSLRLLCPPGLGVLCAQLEAEGSMHRARRSLFTVILGICLATLVAACASSNGGSAPDAEVDAPPVVLDAAVPDALVPDASPDAEPCLPDPDGETCNGNDDDCDGTIDEGYAGVGEACEVGVGGCLRAGTTVCTPDGTTTECGVVAGEPADELCDTGVDENCNGVVDEGFDNLGDVCSAGQGACIASGIYVCSGTGLTTQCNAAPGDGGPELCDGIDNNCNGSVDEGFQVNQVCDGANDGDLCNEGVWACDGAGGRVCSDPGDEDFDVCNGINDDCDPTSGDGSEDGDVGDSCDGNDGDLCFEGAKMCQNGGLVCNDFTGDNRDVCDGGDNDCDPSSLDGSEDPLINQVCDSPLDSDLCTTGFNQCVSGGLQCSDDANSTFDLCGGGDDDCDPTSADGTEHPDRGTACDGAVDSDLCETGTMACSGTNLVCNDDAASTVDLCGGGDEDCDPASPDGSEHAGFGNSCDGAADSDLCATGTQVCSGTALTCDDDAASTVDLCGGGDEDCDPASPDGSEQAGFGNSCDGAADSDLCATGTQVCTGTSLTCNDDAASTVDLCGGGDEDCDPASADGTEQSGYGQICDNPFDSDLCATGNQLCSGTSLVCNDDIASTVDLCGGGDEDCDPASTDGSEHPSIGVACDGTDSDLCSTGVQVCSGTGLACNDDAAATVDLCGGGDEDCDGSSIDGSEHPNIGTACDGTDSDLCTTGTRVCSGTGLACNDDATSTVDLCGGGDEDCDPASGDGSEHPGFGNSCDSAADSDLCATGTQVCSGVNLACNDDAASLIDVCDNVNNDCDGASADGSEDPINGTSCDGGDTDACQEGSNSCVAGGWQCSDVSGSTSEQCNGDAVDENCNGQVDEGYVRDDNSGCWTTDLTSVRGDEGSDQLSRTSNNEEWYRLYISEANDGSVYLSATVSLDSPLGADYDLFVYCFSCGGGLAGSSQLGTSAAAHTDTVNLRADDDFLFEDGHYVLVEVRHISSNRCANYTLRVQGNTTVSSQTCNP